MVQTELLGLNVGNGFTKIATKSNTAVLASYFVPLMAGDINRYEAFNESAVLEIISTTSNESLDGTKWLIGDSAREYFPDTYRQVVDSLAGKQAYALPLFFGAISLAGVANNGAKYKALTSIHDSQVLGSELKAALDGKHVARINGGEIIEIDLLARVGEEGVGAIASIQDLPKGSVGLIDLGHGTTIVSAFRNGRLLEGSRKVIHYGVHQLCEKIASHPDTRRSLNKEASLHLVRQGLKTGFDYGSTKFNFSDIYLAVIKQWISSCLSPAFKHLQPRLESLDALYLTGGGALLPHVSAIASKKDIVTIPSPQIAEAVGLNLLAQKIFGE